MVDPLPREGTEAAVAAMLNWTDQVRAGALNHGSGAPSDPPTPNVQWALYLDDDTGTRYVWTGSAWVELT